jgi:hypothetical protein
MPLPEIVLCKSKLFFLGALGLVDLDDDLLSSSMSSLFMSASLAISLRLGNKLKVRSRFTIKEVTIIVTTSY